MSIMRLERDPMQVQKMSALTNIWNRDNYTNSKFDVSTWEELVILKEKYNSIGNFSPRVLNN